MPLITSCVDNDESASVTNVRDAKAEELRSKAILNKANAQAAEAQALLTQAMATKAQAETELVRIQAEIAKVQLESERVALEAQKAQLEAIKAQAEVEIKAAALKLQQLAQQMEQEKLQNEIDMAKKQQELLNAIAANNTANRAKLASLLNQIQTSESNIIGWQASIYDKQANIVLLEAKIADPTAIVIDQIQKLKDQIAEDEALIAAAKEAMIKDSETLEAELAAIDAKYLEVAKEYKAVEAKYNEVGNKIYEIQNSDEFQNFYTEVRTFMNTYNDNQPDWAGYSYVGYRYITDEDGISSIKYFLPNYFGEEPEEIVFATGNTYDSKKGTRVANTTVDVEALNKVKATLLQKSQTKLDDFNKKPFTYYRDYFYNEEVGLTSETYYENYDNKSKTYSEYLAYYTDLLKRAKYEEKKSAVEAMSPEVEKADAKIAELLKKEQTAYYAWKNSANPNDVTKEEKDYYAAVEAYYAFYGEEYTSAVNAYSENIYREWTDEDFDNQIATHKVNIERYKRDIKGYTENIEIIDKDLEAANKDLADAQKTLAEKEADKVAKHTAYNEARIAYAADPSDENLAAQTAAYNAYDAAITACTTAQGVVNDKQGAVDNLNSNKEYWQGRVNTRNEMIKSRTTSIENLETAKAETPVINAAYKAANDKLAELDSAVGETAKIWKETAPEDQTHEPTYLAFVEAQKATQEARDAYSEISDNYRVKSSELVQFEVINDRVADLTRDIEEAETLKADRDAQVEKLFANVEALAAAAADNNKAVEKIIPLEEEQNKLLNDLRGEEGLYDKLIEVEAEKEAIYVILYDHMDYSEAVYDPVHEVWLVEPVWVKGTTALEEMIAAYEKDIKDCNDDIDQLLALAKTAADDNTALVAQLKRDIEVLKAKIAKEEAVLANLKAEYDTTLAAIK